MRLRLSLTDANNSSKETNSQQKCELIEMKVEMIGVGPISVFCLKNWSIVFCDVH